jgi:cbb3-type cytochrome oxidase subunit 3
MYKNILNSAADSNLLPLIALVFFFLFFSVIVWNTFKMRKEVSDKMSAIPLNDHNKLGEV